jgi:hypothetical protein
MTHLLYLLCIWMQSSSEHKSTLEEIRGVNFPRDQQLGILGL